MMDASKEQIAEVVRDFLARDVGRDRSYFDDDRSLISSGVLDSVVIMRLITFLEETYPMEFMAWELGVNYLDTVALIAQTVHEKLE
jgi:acyl carrier protein